MNLKERCKDYLNEFETPVRRFCAKLGISYSAYYQWQRDELRLADSTLRRIDAYLRRYGF